MKTRNLVVRLVMILFVVFDTSFQLAIAETIKIQLAHNLNLRKTEKRNGKTLLVRETVLRRGTVIEISKEQISSAKKFSYWKNGEKNPISFLTGFKIVSAPGFSESDISSFNSRQTGKDGFYLSKDYVTKGKVIKSDGTKDNVRLEEDADAMVSQEVEGRPALHAASSRSEEEAEAEKLMKDSLSRMPGAKGKSDDGPCDDCEARTSETSDSSVSGTRRDFFNKWVAAGVPAKALRQALAFFKANKGKFNNQRYITINDFTRPSREKRKFILDLKTGAVERYHVAHGQGSDRNHDGKLDRTSSKNKSHATPAGFHRTAEKYHGGNGLSMRLDGLEKSNRTSRARAIVIHAADYVSPGYIRRAGKAGRSHGCPAVSPHELKEIFSKVGGGSLYYNYAG